MLFRCQLSESQIMRMKRLHRLITRLNCSQATKSVQSYNRFKSVMQTTLNYDIFKANGGELKGGIRSGEREQVCNSFTYCLNRGI